MERRLCVVIFLLIAYQNFCALAKSEEYDEVYGYECQLNLCKKVELTEANNKTVLSSSVCRLLCGNTKVGTVWPQPNGKVIVGNDLVKVDIKRITFKFPDKLNKQQTLWEESRARFLQQLRKDNTELSKIQAGGSKLKVIIEIIGAINELPSLTLDTDESYKLTVSNTEIDGAVAKITANSYFGARHGLETLSQLIVYDDIRKQYLMLDAVEIEDAPVYKWRGLLLDTARHFFSVKSIKHTLDGLAMVKLNTLHWHITDAQSFPFELKSHPEFHKLGAYSPRKFYKQQQISEIVQYGLVRGIRVVPEFDAPAHVGEGWQRTKLVVACNYPPSGQLDVTADELYPILEDIYREMFDAFKPNIFHMGSDEVGFSCWNSSASIRDWMVSQGWGLQRDAFYRLWGEFQSKALAKVDLAANNRKIPIILWTSPLTREPYIDQYVDKSRYIIQIWSASTSPDIKAIINRGYRAIISNSDGLYLDCGGPSWVRDGNNWCSPFIGWQKVYENNLETIAGTNKSLVLGAEAVVWSEQIDELTLDYRLWPRSSALAERLWSNPYQGYRGAEARILYHRERLVAHGFRAEALQPDWCVQNEKECPRP